MSWDSGSDRWDNRPCKLFGEGGRQRCAAHDQRATTGGRHAPDDWVLVHVGFAMAKIDETEALLTLAAVKKLGEAYTTEIEAFDSSAIV